MKWIIDGITFEDARSAAEHIMENCDERFFDDMLDECYPEVEICGYSYCASIALYRVDPTAYRCARADWEDAEASDLEWQLERMSDQETLDWYDFEVECIEEEEEEEE